MHSFFKFFSRILICSSGAKRIRQTLKYAKYTNYNKKKLLSLRKFNVKKKTDQKHVFNFSIHLTGANSAEKMSNQLVVI